MEGRTVEATPETQDAWHEGLAMSFDDAVAFALRHS
jgi:hypothetical protein